MMIATDEKSELKVLAKIEPSAEYPRGLEAEVVLGRMPSTHIALYRFSDGAYDVFKCSCALCHAKEEGRFLRLRLATGEVNPSDPMQIETREFMLCPGCLQEVNNLWDNSLRSLEPNHIPDFPF